MLVSVRNVGFCVETEELWVSPLGERLVPAQSQSSGLCEGFVCCGLCFLSCGTDIYLQRIFILCFYNSYEEHTLHLTHNFSLLSKCLDQMTNSES